MENRECEKKKQNGQDCKNEQRTVNNAVKGKKTFRSALPQVLATSAKNILLLGYGMTLGFPTIVIPSLQPHHGNVTDSREKDTLSLTEEQISWFSSINLICVPLGCLMSGALSQPVGRKRSMIAVNVPFVVAWVMFHYASNVGMLYACLVLTGLSGGLLEAPKHVAFVFREECLKMEAVGVFKNFHNHLWDYMLSQLRMPQ